MSPWSEAPETTLRCEQHAPERPHEGEASPQEVVAWLRDDTVHHLKRGKALRGTLTLTSLVYEVSPSSLKADTSAARKDQGPPAAGMATVTEVNLFYPLCKDWGAAKRGRGKERNTPPPSSPVSL